MILKLLLYIALGVYADLNQQYILSIFCYVTPFLGGNGMLTAFIAGVWFMVGGFYLPGAIAIGFVVLQLLLNKYWPVT